MHRTSFDRKKIIVEVPISEGFELRIFVGLKLTDDINLVKRDVLEALIDQANCGGGDGGSSGGGYWEAFSDLAKFDLYFDDNLLCSGSTLADFGVDEHVILKLAWTFDGLDVSIPTDNGIRKVLRINNIKHSDTVEQMKARCWQMTRVPPEKQLWGYKKRWLREGLKSLAECGIIFCPSKIFPWKRHINALDVFVMVDTSLSVAPWMRSFAPHFACDTTDLLTMICPCKHCPWHKSILPGLRGRPSLASRDLSFLSGSTGGFVWF